MDVKPLIAKFKKTFNQSPEVFKAPGRVNIIGEHTDYNDGLVLPFPIKQAIYFAAAPRKDMLIHIHALDIGKSTIIDLEKISLTEPWTRFFIGALITLKEDAHEVRGLNIMINGDIPFGAGISSSSALTCGFIFLIQQIHELNISKRDIVFLASRAENGTGLNGGKMDQFSICMGEEKKAILLDCRDYSYRLIDCDVEGASWFLFDTKVEHNLAETGYNDRRADCEVALKQIKIDHPEINSLRDVNLNLLNDNIDLITKTQYNRVQHYIDENHRVIDMVQALSENDLVKAGQLLYESHQSLAKLYEVSSDELDFIVNKLSENDGCFGARMMGGGFGGSVIALLKNQKHDFSVLEKSYTESFDLEMNIIPVESRNGIEKIY